MLREEKETIIRWDETPSKATVYTYNASLNKKLERYMSDHPDDVELVRKDVFDDGIAITWKVPKKWVKVSPPRKINLSDEEKAKRSAILQQARSKKVSIDG